MRTIFVDTSYWIARVNPRDQLHQKALELDSSLKNDTLVTSEPVLIEVLNYFSGYGPEMRWAAARIVRHIMSSVTVLPYYFEEGLSLFEARLDKGYSMTDCISMHIMRQVRARDVLTHDRHFAQEGFTTLL